ncbi:hypothetical protein BG004_001985 [Podila humilis]|nr:hypothetical protein BG004_001985 [Podila humilis]
MSSEIESDSEEDFKHARSNDKSSKRSTFRRDPSDELYEGMEDLGTPPSEMLTTSRSDQSRGGGGVGGRIGGSGSKSSKSRIGAGGGSPSMSSSSSSFAMSRSKGGGGGFTTASKLGQRRPLPEDESDDDNEETPVFKPDALKLSAEFLRLFTIEALHRATRHQREQEEDDLLRDDDLLLEVESIEAITPQLLLDF